MKVTYRKLSFFLVYLVVFINFFASILLASEKEVNDMKQVTNVLELYRKSIDISNFAISAKCSPPPMDKLNVSNENMITSYKEFAIAFEKAWGKELNQGVNLEFLKTHPLSHLSNYKYKNISIQGIKATADTEVTVDGQVRKSVQHLAKINGKWYITQKNGPPDYSEIDKNKIKSLANLLQKQADFINGIVKQIAAGTITQDECLEIVRNKIMEFEEKRESITNS